MPTPELSFGKITSTPTQTGWSQAYNAGGLFVILSLDASGENSETETLGAIGKKYFNDLEAEFFTLEEKNAVGISKALTKTTAEVSENIRVSTLAAYCKEGLLYLFLLGAGKVYIKRGKAFGTLLSSEEDGHEVKSASGKLEEGDTVLLASGSFRKNVNDETVQEALGLNDIDEAVETLMPAANQAEDGTVCALILRQKEAAPPLPAKEEASSPQMLRDIPQIDEVPTPEYTVKETYETPQDLSTENKKGGSFLFTKFLTGLSHRRKVILSVATLLIIILGLSIFFTLNTQAANERRELFDSIYPEALESYEEAEGLVSLNKALAREELENAQKILSETEGKFPPGTDEYAKTEALLEKVSKLLDEVGEARLAEAKEISKDESLILSSLLPNAAIAAIEDETSVYILTSSEINSLRKGSKSEQTLVENDDDWGKAVGLGKFGSNFYVLDTQKGVLKLVPSGTDYSASDYLVDDVSTQNATSMALDSSVYILFKDGSIKKFNRGREEDFSLTGLENNLKSPTQIVTSEDMDSLYILDPQTARIVKLKKNGVFEEEYQSQVLQGAKAIAISQDESTAYILQNGKLYEISL